MSWYVQTDLKLVAFTFAIAAAGVGAFYLFGLPLPWLLGPIFSCLIAALIGVPLRGFKPLNDAMRTILGVAVGATLTPAVLMSFTTMWPTLALVIFMTMLVALVGVPYFQRGWGYDFPTAYYSAVPGGLQDMLVFGEEAGGNVRTLSLIHATRILVIVVILPILLAITWQVDLTKPPGAPVLSVPILELLIMIGCAVVGWQIAKRLGMFGASILGPLIAAAFITLAGGLHNRPPAEAIWAAQFFIGMSIGANYAGITMTEVRRDITAAFGFCAILMVLTLVFVVAIYHLDLAPSMDVLLAFAPGGQAEMTILALIIGADVAFVVAHHIVRIFFVILGAPIIARIFRGSHARIG